jgi:hypothetical protein
LIDTHAKQKTRYLPENKGKKDFLIDTLSGGNFSLENYACGIRKVTRNLRKSPSETDPTNPKTNRK